MKITNLIMIAATGILLLPACGGVRSTSSNGNENVTLAPVPEEYASLTNPLGQDAAGVGAELFRTNCEMCHGPRGYGDGPAGQSLEPRPGNLAVIQTQAGDGYLFWRIHEGKPGTSMVAWQGVLSDEEIWQVIAFIRTLR